MKSAASKNVLLKHSDGNEDSDSMNQLFQGSVKRGVSKDREWSQITNGIGRSKIAKPSEDDFVYSQTDNVQSRNNYVSIKGKAVNNLLADSLEPIEEVLDPRLYGIPERVDVEGELRRYSLVIVASSWTIV